MKVRINLTKVTIFIFLSINMMLMTHCFPDRVPTEPDYEGQDVRRPAISYNLPKGNDTGIDRNTNITIWFDELMNLNSVRDNFSMWPSVSLDSIQTLAISPVAPEIIFVGNLSQGVFKSTNSGESWQWMTKNAMRQTVRDIALSYTSNDILYAATDSGVYRSINGGGDWDQVKTGLTDLLILSIATDPANHDVVYVTTENDGVFKSEDAGNTWNAKNNGINTGRPLFDIVVDPVNSQVIYVATEGNFIMRSTDGGESWTRLRSGLSTRDFKVLAVHPVYDNIIYAGAVSGGIHRSNNMGDNWTDISSDIGNRAIRTIALDNADTNFVIVGTEEGIFKSINAGVSWNLIGDEQTSVQVGALQLNPSDQNILFVGTDDAVYKSLDGGDNFNTSTSIQMADLYIPGEFQFETWRDSTIVDIIPVDSVTNDTIWIKPYIYERALTGWDGTGEPPVDPNPSATKLIYTLSEILLPDWKYQVRINGTFESDKETLKSSFGARDINGNSFETDKNFTFRTGNN